MIHANRFGEFEEICAGGVYLADVWLSWLETFTDVRNQLETIFTEVGVPNLVTISAQFLTLWNCANSYGLVQH